MNILLADDEETIVEILHDIIESLFPEAKTRLCTSLEQVEENASWATFAIVDYNMPPDAGCITKYLKSVGVPYALMSGEHRLMDPYAVAVLEKPFDIEQIRKLLGVYMVKASVNHSFEWELTFPVSDVSLDDDRSDLDAFDFAQRPDTAKMVACETIDSLLGPDVSKSLNISTKFGGFDSDEVFNANAYHTVVITGPTDLVMELENELSPQEA